MCGASKSNSSLMIRIWGEVDSPETILQSSKANPEGDGLANSLAAHPTTYDVVAAELYTSAKTSKHNWCRAAILLHCFLVLPLPL